MFDVYELKNLQFAVATAKQTIEISLPEFLGDNKTQGDIDRAHVMIDKLASLEAKLNEEIEKKMKQNVTIKTN
jgi:hypothetical protein